MKDTLIYVCHGGFATLQNAFYFDMIDKVVKNLLSTGIMKHLIEENAGSIINLQDDKKDPKVLNLNDLLFGFNIWLGSCFLSAIAFTGELLTRLCKKRRKFFKVSFAKVYPSNNEAGTIEECNNMMISLRVNTQNFRELEL